MTREYDKVMATAMAMEKRGGGFVKCLGKALAVADQTNRERIHNAFPEYWEQYKKIAEKNDWYMHD